MSGARDRAALLEAFVRVLLPGDQDFPSGAQAGVQGKLAERLIELEGEAAFEALIAAIAGLAETPTGEAQRTVVAAFEAEQPERFATARNICFVSYYESPLVQEAIRALGFAYNAAPLPKGYPAPRFDLERDRPSHGRGRYIPTDEVRRVDLSGLDLPGIAGKETNDGR